MRRAKMVQLTIWSNPKEMIDTQYGFITIKKWLKREEKRIAEAPDRCAEIRCGKIGRYEAMALFVDDRRMTPKELRSRYGT
jgi:hypothetical protein